MSGDASRERALRGRAALVTGAARGIGRAIAARLASAGASVVLADIEPGDAGHRLAQEIEAAGGAAIVVQADVADVAGHAALVERARAAFGGLHILVNNAGLQRREPFLETPVESWDAVLDTNLRGAYFLSQAAARAMGDRGGAILNVGSIHHALPLPLHSTYAISKAGLEMLTRALAVELAPHGIRVNAVAPGAIRTDRNPHFDDAAVRARAGAKIPLGRVGEPADIAGASLFLVSDDAAYVTGATLHIDGGLRLKL